MNSKKASKKKRIPIHDVSEPSVCPVLSVQIYSIISLIPNKIAFFFIYVIKKHRLLSFFTF